LHTQDATIIFSEDEFIIFTANSVPSYTMELNYTFWSIHSDSMFCMKQRASFLS